MPTLLDALLDRYIERFGEPQLNMAGVSDDLLTELIEEALERGRPIPEKDYYRHLPPDADA